ncbi:hypothetical protein SAMN05444172_1600 [Burkholderia sp. GAS332]|nr:hypothetical protein SAMN05444172_1600 [Burkholderia sp. GAS332]
MNHIQHTHEAQATPALVTLAAARQATIDAVEKQTEAHSKLTALVQRRADANAEANLALADYRSGKCSAEASGVRHAGALADVHDLGALIAQGQQFTRAADDAVATAKAHEQTAEFGAKNEEYDLAIEQLKRQAVQAETALIGILGELGRVNRMRNPRGQSSLSLFSVWSASSPLKDAVNRYIPPAL